MSQHIYYNAVNHFYQGNYNKLDTAWNRTHNWRAAWEAIRAETSITPEKTEEAITRRNIRLILRSDTDYPPLLMEIARPPFGIYILGTCDWSRPAVAIVGTRRATSAGLTIAHTFAKDLATQGISIISGLALGIDGAAHNGALASQARGATTAVLPCGLDDIYPKTHAHLANDIIRAGGALISEYPLKTPSFPIHFLERNRIIAGLCRGTLVIEAPHTSGALVTAKLALEANRDVCAVPGPIHHANYAGPHALIKEGATLVTCAEDVCNTLNLIYQKSSVREDTKAIALSPEERIIIATIKKEGKALTIDTIAELSHLEIPVISRAVALLSINGTLTELDGRYLI